MDMTVEVAETQIKMFHHLERPSHCTQMNNVAVEMEQKKWAPDRHCRHSNVAKLEPNVSRALPRGVL